jgi:hypothetical protein
VKNFCAGFIFITIGLSLFGQNVNDFTFITNDDQTITITGYTGSASKIEFPRQINNTPATIIGNGKPLTFSESVTEVVIPEGVTAIGVDAFAFRKWDVPGNVSRFTLPESLRTIGSAAFIWNDITSINIPAGVTSIGEMAFGHPRNFFIYQNMSSTVRDGLVAKFGEDIFDTPW